jgi:hydroxymethylpyrimidine/phosphomethylpyrimidine kinase
MAGRNWACDDRANRKTNAQRPTLNVQRSIHSPPIALTIAGSDSSAGAGIQADLKTFTALGVYGLTAVTCLVSEIPGKVSRIEAATSTIVRDQIQLLLKNFAVGAIKTGLLCSGETVCAVAKTLRHSGRRIPLVIDPVMIATSGEPLLERSAIDAYKNELFPLATLITPNLDEAGLLLGTKIKGRKQMAEAAKTLGKKFRCAMLLKGGHLDGDEAIDLLFDNGQLKEFSACFVRGLATHGTGCTYSAAITAGLASSLSLDLAVGQAKKFVTQSIAQHFRWKRRSAKPVQALNHSI